MMSVNWSKDIDQTLAAPSFAALVATEGITAVHVEVIGALARFTICSLVRERNRCT